MVMYNRTFCDVKDLVHDGELCFDREEYIDVVYPQIKNKAREFYMKNNVLKLNIVETEWNTWDHIEWKEFLFEDIVPQKVGEAKL